MYIDSGNLLLNQSAITRNRAEVTGATTGGDLTLLNSTAHHNGADQHGGG